MSSKPYTGPPVAEMLRAKTLAENIIRYHSHDSSNSILDDANLALLQRFVNDPSKRADILRDADIDPEEALEGKKTGLAAYAVWAHGREDMDGGVLKGEDVEMLRRWFEGKKAA